MPSSLFYSLYLIILKYLGSSADESGMLDMFYCSTDIRTADGKQKISVYYESVAAKLF